MLYLPSYFGQPGKGISNFNIACIYCKNSLSIFKDPSSSRKLPPLFKYDSLQAPPPATRAASTQSCVCPVCDIGRLKNFDYKTYWQSHSNPVGRPSESVESPPAKTLALYTKCFSEVGKGKSHECVKSSKAENLANLVRSTSHNSKAKVASATIQDIAEKDSGVSKRGALCAFQGEAGSFQ